MVALLGAGLALRLGLAYVVFPNSGYAGDIGLFSSWAATLAKVGPGAFYASAASANYPPVYLYVLWLLGGLATPVGAVLGVSAEQALLLMLKLPAILADLAIAVLICRAAGRWFGGRSGLVAAALYLFIPVTWYDSALWGQVDAVAALPMLAGVVLLLEGWSEPAAALAVLAVLVKPQDAIALAVVGPVLLRRHLLKIGSGPRPELGPRLAALDRGLGGLLTSQGPIRLATSAAMGAVVGIAVLLPFDITRFAPPSLATVPVIGHVAGLVGLFVSLGGQFSVLTANAYNAWALAGPDPLATIIGSGGSWTADSLAVAGGLSAVTIGGGLLAAVSLLVVGGLLVRDGRLPIVLGFTVLAFAFYALPTRVHERYLFPVFTTGAILGGGVLAASLSYVAVGLLNTINLHAVLVGSLRIGGVGGFGQGGGPGGSTGGGFGAGGGGAGGFGLNGGGGFGGARVGSIQLPFGDLARGEAVVMLVAVGQTLAFVGLVAAWLVVLVRPGSVERRLRGPARAVTVPKASLGHRDRGPIETDRSAAEDEAASGNGGIG